jgi:hypothetical protein
MKVCFLFGSGASVPAGMPKVGEVTERVLSGDDPSPVPNSTGLNKQKEARQKYLRWLGIQVKRRYACEPDRPVNYEDLYYLTSQIHDDLSGEYDNPAVRPLIEKAFAEVLPSLTQSHGNIGDELKRIAGDAKDYIRTCVMLLLRAELRPLDYLDFVSDAFNLSRCRCRVIHAARRILTGDFQASSGRGLDILTLNHDTVLERFLDSREIPFADGFDKEPNIVKVRRWQPTTLQVGQNAIRLLKLHGGVDWYRFRPHGVQDWLEDYCGIPTTEYLDTSPRDNLGRMHEWPDRLPFFLIGTFNKLAEYTSPVYLEVYYRAFQSLEETDVLVVVGYGFGDKGINKLITGWMCQKLERRLVVVGRDADNLWRRARGAIRNNWANWLNAAPRRLFPVPFELENKLSWERVASLLR